MLLAPEFSKIEFKIKNIFALNISKLLRMKNISINLKS